MPFKDPTSRICSKCQEPRSVTEFRKRDAQCRECRKAYAKRYYADRRTYFEQYRETHRTKYREQNVEILRRSRAERYAALDVIKSQPCVDCRGVFPLCVMDFDHRDPGSKTGAISSMAKHSPWEKVLDEIAKCDLVCVNCHRARTWSGSSRVSPKRQFLRDLKKAPCLDCGKQLKPHQMDFDHVRGEKLIEVSQATGFSERTLLEEIQKCDVVCANCHRLRTSARETRGHKRAVLNPDRMAWSRRRVGSLQTTFSGEVRS